MDFRNLFMALALLIAVPINVFAQVSNTDSLNSTTERAVENYNFNWRQTILPASLITAGAVAIAPGFLRHGNHGLTNAIIDLRGNHRRLEFDDYIQYLPVVGAWTLGCVGAKAKHTFVERTLIVATSYASLGVLTNVPKYFVDEKRPEFAGHNSFPSGHTATVFMGAELVRIEYGGWYGIGAYTVAVGVGFMRMYNGRHWFNDVVAGAGIGILSARIGEWSACLWQKLLKKKERKEQNFALTPIASPLGGGYYGFSMGCCF